MVAPKKAKQKDIVTNKTATKKTTVKKSRVKKSKAKNKEVQLESSPEKVMVIKENDNLLVLDAMTIINDAQSLHESLLKLSESNETVTLDVSKVEAIDTAAFQLLLAFVSKMNRKNVKFIWHEPSEAFLERASLMNLMDDLYLVDAR